MKSIIVSILLSALCINAYSQKIDRNENDEFTGTRIITTQYGQDKSPRAADKIATEHSVYTKAMYFKDESSEIYVINMFFITTIDFGCLSKYDGKMMLLFDDGSTMTLTQTTDTDCSDNPSPGYLIVSDEESKQTDWKETQKSNLKKIISSPVKKIRIYGSEGYYDYELLPDKKTIFSQHLKAIEDAK
jgi:hypothetical protein